MSGQMFYYEVLSLSEVGSVMRSSSKWVYVIANVVIKGIAAYLNLNWQCRFQS
jgi:hypothetical protein